MRLTVAVAAMAFFVGGASQAVAQEAAGASAPAPTPEAAAKFIDTVLGNGVAKIARLEDTNNSAGLDIPETARTANCKTVILYKRESFGRSVLEVDWRTYVASNSYFTAAVTDRWGARVLARTAYNLISDNGAPNPLAAASAVGVMIEPGTEELKDRLIRAADFYGKSCAPKIDGPF